MTDSSDNFPKSVKVLIICLLLLGVFFRFYNIDRQLYWNDEVYTSLRIAGYQLSEVNQELRDSGLISVAEMQTYQIPNSRHTAADTIRGLVMEEPQHVPLYFVLARYWMQWFGNSTAVVRSLSAFLSLLAFPCMYWLCRELFNSSKVAWVSMALIAVSPMYVLYAQEARPYSMYIVAILLSSAALLRAMRVNTGASWAIYAATVAAGLYTQILFGLVAVAHAVYVFAITRFRITRTSIAYVVASFTALLAFVPWLYVLITHRAQGVEWTQAYQPLILSLTRWSGIVSRTFLDLGIGPGDSMSAKLCVLPFIALILILIAYSIYFLIRTAPMRQWLFVVSLIASLALPFFLLDVTFGKRYGTTRFIISSSIGIQLALAYLLAMHIDSFATLPQRRRLWQGVAAMLILAGGVSCAIRSQSDNWWNKVPSSYGDYPQIARIVNRASQPVLYSYGSWSKTQMICHRLNHSVRLQLLDADQVPEQSMEFEDVFLFEPSDAARVEIEKAYDVKVEQIQSDLWKLAQR